MDKEALDKLLEMSKELAQGDRASCIKTRAEPMKGFARFGGKISVVEAGQLKSCSTNATNYAERIRENQRNLYAVGRKKRAAVLLPQREARPSGFLRL